MLAISIGPWEGTHQRLDGWARAILADLPFPSLAAIHRYEGMGPRTPDGASILYRNTISRNSYHYYNPATGEGNAINRVQRYWRSLVCELDRPYGRRAARAAAWMAHFVTDTLSPAHHHGHFVAPPAGLAPDAWYRDWFDPYWDTLPVWKQPLGPHATFEGRIVLETPLNYDPQELIVGGLSLIKNEEELRLLLVREAEAIATSGIYENYVKRGWSPEVRQGVLRHVLPRQTALIAGLWQSAINARSQT